MSYRLDINTQPENYHNMSSETGWFGRLEAKTPILFLVGGALYSVLVANRILTTYTGTSFELASTIAWVAWVLVALGLLGLYPTLVDRRPYLSRAAAAIAVIPAVCSAIVVVGETIKAAGIISEAPGLLGLAPFAAFITMYLVFALFGITTLLADVHPKSVGVLMLVSAAGFLLFMTLLSGLPGFIANGVNLIVYLGIGIILLNTDVPTAEVGPSADPTA